MSQPQSTILNGPSDDPNNAKITQQDSTIRSSSEDLGSQQYIPNKNPSPNSENFTRPQLTRLDSRSNVLIRPGYPNQPGVQFRPPPPRPGAPQFAQRPPVRPPAPGQQQFPTNIGPRPGNATGIRPATPYPRQPPPNTPRPQIYSQKPRLSADSDQINKILESTNIQQPNSGDDNTEFNGMSNTNQNMSGNLNVNQNMSSNYETHKEINENRKSEIPSINQNDNRSFNIDNTNGKSEEFERPESRTNSYMNRIDEDEQSAYLPSKTLPTDISIKNQSPQPESLLETQKMPRKEEIKSPIERPSSAMRSAKSPMPERPSSAMKSPSADKRNLDLSPRTRKVPDSFNGKLRSPKSEGDNDSGVDESTQGNDQSSNGDHNSPRKSSGRMSARNLQSPTKPRSASRGSKSPLPKSPDSAASSTIGIGEKKKVPMNKVQVGAAPSPNLKEVKSKIGSLQNSSYKPGGGHVKIENKKIDIKAQPRVAAKNSSYTPKGGDKKNLGSSSYREIPQQKLQWNASSKIGSLENATHKPKGGDKKIECVKLDFKERAKSKVGSKDNIKHVPGGGDIKFEDDYMDNKAVKNQLNADIESKKIDIKAEAKVGSLDNVKHKPKGGDKKIFDDKEYLRQMSGQSDHQSFGGSQNSLPSQPDAREPISDENLNSER